MESGSDLERALEELQAGVSPEENFQRLFVHFWSPLHRFFARCGIPPEQRSDLTQETFVGIYYGVGGFRREARLESWIFSIASNVYRKHLRHKSAGKRAARELSLDDSDSGGGASLEASLVEESADRMGPELRLLGRERTQQLLEAIDALPDKMRKCLILRSFQDLTYHDIAMVMRLSPETVRSHLFHARRKLKKMLSEAEGVLLDDPESAHG